jgi:hypothetical protein
MLDVFEPAAEFDPANGVGLQLDSAEIGAHGYHQADMDTATDTTLVAAPGHPNHFDVCMAHPDPLSVAGEYRFSEFTYGHDSGSLVDTDGDGIPDHTRWGTPVIQVEGYVRQDGTVVSSHFRTVPDGVTWNNLSRGN